MHVLAFLCLAGVSRIKNEAVSHRPSSNSSIAFSHHCRKFTVIYLPVLQVSDSPKLVSLYQQKEESIEYLSKNQ